MGNVMPDAYVNEVEQISGEAVFQAMALTEEKYWLTSECLAWAFEDEKQVGARLHRIPELLQQIEGLK